MTKDATLQQKTSDELISIIDDLQANLDSKSAIIQNQNTTISQLLEQLKLNKHKRFGAQSEKDNDNPQLSLFDEAQEPDNQPEIDAADEELTIPEHKRKKRGRKPLPKGLPRKQKVYDIPESDKACHCGCALTAIGEEVTEQLNIIPAKVFVIEHIRKKYACKSCEETIKQAKMPKQPIPKSIAGPGLLAHVLVAKFHDHLPLYRQESILQRMGIDIPRATLSHWVLKCGELLLPLTKLLLSQIQAYDVAYADESTVQVLNEPGRAPQTKSYMWVLGGGPPDKFGMVYSYSPSRGHQVPLDLLEDFKGYLHCDGFQVYDVLSAKQSLTLVGCWYHVRRKFVEANKVSSKAGLAKQAINIIKKLSLIEKQAKAQLLTPEGIYQLRKRKALPIIKAFKVWLEKHAHQVPRQSLIGNAIHYTLNQWPKLMGYLKDGRLEISNNRTERAIKPFATGRKNWLFANSVAGAKAAATIYSLIQTCKYHDVNPYDYLAHVLEAIPSCLTIEKLEPLLPYHFKATS